MEYFKPEKSSVYNEEWAIAPMYKLWKDIEEKGKLPFSINAIIYNLYNYSLRDLFKFIIAEYQGIIHLINEFPYFTISFESKEQAYRFCNQIDELYAQKKLYLNELN